MPARSSPRFPRDIVFAGVRHISVATPGEGRSNEIDLHVLLDRDDLSLVDVRWLVLLGEL